MILGNCPYVGGMFRLIPIALLAACSTVTPDTQGQVFAFNGDTVTIRGGFDPNQRPPKPTPAMAMQAQEVCPGATFLSGSPDTAENSWAWLYVFRC